MPVPAAIRLERDGGLAVATLDRPPLNLFDSEMFESLKKTIDAVEADRPRALLFRAEGRAVSGGVNVAEFDGLTPERGGALWDELIGAVERVEALPLPVVFAAHALTLTAAFELALGCDLILAARSAKFGLVEKVVGLTPSMGGTQRLGRAGRQRAGPRAGDDRRAVRRRGAGEMERRQPGLRRRGLRRAGARVRRGAGAGADQGARDDEAGSAPLPRRRYSGCRQCDPHRGRRALRHRGPAARGQNLPRARWARGTQPSRAAEPAPGRVCARWSITTR